MKPYTDNDRAKLQKNLAVIRKLAGWTSADLGELIGVTKQTISGIENNRSTMTKTQYIAIRAMIDYEIECNPENVALAQAVNLILDSDELTEEDQVKVDTTVAYISGAKEKGMSDEAIAAGMAGLAAALGLSLMALPVMPVAVAAGATVAKKAGPKWLEAINYTRKIK